mgnify:CR=1 FL=1
MDDNDARLCEATMLAKIEASHDLGRWLVNYTPPNGVGFMFDSHPNTQRISRMVESDGHSGASFAGCPNPHVLIGTIDKHILFIKTIVRRTFTFLQLLTMK